MLVVMVTDEDESLPSPSSSDGRVEGSDSGPGGV